MTQTEFQQQAKSYAEVRARLNSGVPAKRLTEESQEEVFRLRKMVMKRDAEIEILQFDIKLKDAENKKLQRYLDRAKQDIADREARILSQAKIICETRVEDDLGEFHDKKSFRAIVDEVLENYPGVSFDEVISIRRLRHLITPRQHCCYEVYRQRKDISLPRLGRMMGGRDHTTILYSIRKYEKEIGEYPPKA